MNLRTFSPIVLFGGLFSFSSQAVEVSGRIGLESRYFLHDDTSQNSFLVEPELYWESDSADNSFTFKVFGRYDDLDDERSHIDIREAMWLHVGDSWELRAGIGKVYWGVAESNHLVDIINQTDAIESADGEQKLGQPMVQLTTIKDWGVLDVFVLPYFRERSFPGEDGRLGGSIAIDTDNARYESGQEEQHVDIAFRYSNTINIFDFGISGFSGTNRDPKFFLPLDNRPYYDQMQHLGIDAQATLGDWLLKFEAVYREDSVDEFFAEVAGLEYTFTGVFDSAMDLGVLTEYSYDSRDMKVTPLDNDLFFGARLTLNDVQSTELLIGASQDMEESSSRLMFIEGSRRIGDSWKLTIDARSFSSDEFLDPVYQLRNEDYVSATFELYY